MSKPNDLLSQGRKFTKEEVDYKLSSEPKEHRCGICEYRLHIGGTDRIECGIVEGGIEDLKGCKLFEIDLIHAALHPGPKPSK
jgi:hypothetical protein